jgi:hypothetical protein
MNWMTIWRESTDNIYLVKILCVSRFAVDDQRWFCCEGFADLHQSGDRQINIELECSREAIRG